jgi:hypothetical protein
LRKTSLIQSALTKPRVFLALAVGSIEIWLAVLSFAAPISGIWAIAFSPKPGISNYLEDLTCTSASDCWAVGYYYNDNAQTLIEHWDGTKWSIVPSPNTTATLNQLFGIACVSASDCWAVGSSKGDPFQPPNPYRTLIEHWDGTAWAIVATPNANDHDNSFLRVTCASASDCWAVGNYYNGSNLQTLIEHWDGNAWTVIASPNADPNQRNYFNDVTCASSSDCWAVGAYNIDSNIRHQLIEHWNGTAWAIVATPNTSATEDNRLVGLVCPSASDCWAVGFHTNSGNTLRTLTEHWDGNVWTIITSPNTSGIQDNNSLYGVTCTSGSDCWAVGTYYNDGGQPTLIEHWNGTAWKVVSSPNAKIPSSATFAALVAVACATASDCWAVGYDTDEALIEYYLTSTELGNISTRLNVQTGGNVAIAGFIISGQPQRVLIRALGPTIAKPPFNVPNTLDNPKLVLYDQSQTPIASNDNWGNTVIDGTVITADQEGEIENSAYAPSSANESVIIATLPAGNYTAIVSGVNNTTGVALVEVYNVTSSNSGNLTNISTRGSAQTGDSVMIGGFIVIGKGPRTVVVRGLGPTLTQFGVAGALGDPTLELRDGNGNLLASDDNWKDAQQTEIQSTGLAPPNDLEPAILATLSPANYTAILRGKNNTTGAALVETYVTN